MQAVERALARALEQPYPGLRPFEPFESFLFFGRKKQTQDLLEQLSANRFIAVVGESGSGKSSLVRAGLLPHLYRGYLTGTTSQWRIAILRPGSNPLDELSTALSDRQVLGPAEGMREELGRSSRGLLTCVRNAKLAPGESLLILVDQFEELFRFERERRVRDSGAEASLFVTSLLEAVGAYGSPVYVVITMRSDYLGECSRFQGLPEALNRSQYLVPRLTRDQKQECIESPAAIGGAKLTPRLVQHLLNDVGDDPDHLPVLQHALMRMFQVWAKAGRQGEIDLEHYLHEEVGGMTQALNHHADSIYEEFSADEQEWVRRVFRCLTTEESGRLIRRPARLDRLYTVTGADTADEQELVNRIIRKFLEPENALLVVSTPGQLDADTVIDISHESLIRKWTVLREWVREEGQSAEWYRSVVRDVERNQKGDAGLWRDPNLARALERWERDGWNAEWARQYWPREQPSFQEVTAFLELSSRTQQAEREKEEARRQEEIQTERELRETAEARAKAEREAATAARRTSRIVAVGSLAMLVAAAAFSLFLLHSRRQAQSRQYAAQALLALPRNPESALRTAVSAGEAAETLEAERALSSVLDQAVPALVVRAGNAVQEARFTADGNRIVTVGTDGVQQEWDAHSGAPAGRDIRVRGEAPTSPDGSRSVAPAENDGVSRLRDKALGRVIELRGHSGRVLSAGFSPDSTKVVTAGVDGTARTFDALTGRPLRTFVGHTLGIQRAEFSRDGRKVVTASDDGTAIVWDVETGQAIAQALAHSRPILWAEFSPDGSRIATASSDQTARIWDIDGGRAK